MGQSQNIRGGAACATNGGCGGVYFVVSRSVSCEWIALNVRFPLLLSRDGGDEKNLCGIYAFDNI